MSLFNSSNCWSATASLSFLSASFSSTEACDSRIARSTTACFDCYGGILKKSKVDNVIQKQKEFMEYLNKDSIEYRTEMDDLNKLEDLRNKLIKD
jgi:hypothetical protein